MANNSVQLNLPPGLLPKETRTTGTRVNHTQNDALRPERTHEEIDADSMASELFDEALTAARITTAEVAYLFGCSESVVRRMRSKDARERVSFAQLLRLPPAFHIELHRVMNRRFGFGRAALLRLLDAVGDLASVAQL
jgi:hypothetical protein